MRIGKAGRNRTRYSRPRPTSRGTVSGPTRTARSWSSKSPRTTRTPTEKPTAYGQAGIPLYLLIDRDSCTVTVHSNPDRQVGGYRTVETAKFGEKVCLPGPMNIELDTEILKNYVR
jgi:hypothetical protein